MTAPPQALKQVRKRRPQERAEVTRRKLIEVALQEFSKRGYDAVTVRDIEITAGLQRNLLSYHFGGKEEMWKAAASHVFQKVQEFTSDRQDLVQDLSPHERLAYTIRSYVRFCARNPELNRMMLQEGKQDSWRMRWLMDEFLRPKMEEIRQTVEFDRKINDQQFVHWYYVFVSGAMIFSMAPEAALLFDIDVQDDEVVDRHAQTMAALLLNEFPN